MLKCYCIRVEWISRCRTDIVRPLPRVELKKRCPWEAPLMQLVLYLTWWDLCSLTHTEEVEVVKKNWKHDTDQQAHWFDGLVPPTPLISNSPPNPPSRISFWSSKPSCRRNENYLMRYSCRSENAWLCSFHSWPEWHHQRKRGWSKKCSIASKWRLPLLYLWFCNMG